MTVALQRKPLRAVRLAHGLTQRDVAKAAGVSDALVSRWERALPPLWRRLERICDVLNVSADEVLGRTPVTPVVDALDAADRRLLDAMRADAERMFGAERLARMGGWRRIASYAWRGFLQGRVDALLALPAPDAARVATVLPIGNKVPNEAVAREPYQRLYPVDWFEGWESPIQEARRLNQPDPKRRAIAAQQRRALKRGTP